MNTNETIAILKIIKLTYPHFYKGMNKEEGNDLIDLWSTMFEDDDIRIVTQAVKSLVLTHTYPPSIADVKEKIRLLTQTENELTEMEAWNLLYKAICNSSYHAQEYYDRLPEIIQECVGTPKQLREWAQMEGDSLHTVIQSNFMRSYKQKVKHKQEIAKIPNSIRLAIDNIVIQKKLN